MVQINIYYVTFNSQYINFTQEEKRTLLNVVISNPFYYTGLGIIISEGKLNFYTDIEKETRFALKENVSVNLPQFHSLSHLFQNISSYSIKITDERAFEKLAQDLYIEDNYPFNKDNIRQTYPNALLEACTYARLKYVPNIGPTFVFKMRQFWFLVNIDLRTGSDLTISNCKEMEFAKNYFEVNQKLAFGFNMPLVDEAMVTLFNLCVQNETEC